MIKFILPLFFIALTYGQSIVINSLQEYMVNFAIHFVVQQAIKTGAVPNGDYKIDAIYNKELGDLDSPYLLTASADVHLSGDNGVSFRVTVTVTTDYIKKFHKITGYSYVLDSNTDLSEVIFGTENPEGLFEETDDLWVDSDDPIVTADLLDYTGEDWTQTEIGVQEMNITVFEQGDFPLQEPGALNEMSISEFNHDTDVQYRLIHSLGNALNKIVNDPNNTQLQGLSGSDFHITQILEITYFADMYDTEGDPNEEFGNTRYYFEVEVENGQGIRLRINLYVTHTEPWTGGPYPPDQLNSYSFVILNRDLISNP